MSDRTVTDRAPGRHGTPAVFPGCWGRSCPLCERCWHDTRRLVRQHDPAVIIHDTTAQ